MFREDHQTTKFNRAAGCSGFSLIELLIVVAVILIIAGIAIPNFLRSKMAANEAAAIANTRTITTSNVVYSTTYGIGYAAGLANMATPPPPALVTAAAAGLLDNILAAGTKSGYVYTYVAGPLGAGGTIDAYTLQADPLTPNITGTRHFFVDATGVIRFNSAAAAGPTDSPVQ
ncbi:MAG: type II secretion system protein [Candidatus Acidiferrales bacterium]|jgi:prepilin-type N-terminal cleavage/methylation domain-containing protein